MNLSRFVTRRNIILASVILVVVVGLLFSIQPVSNYLSQRNITFSLAEGVKSITISNSDATTSCSSSCPSVVSLTINKSGQVRLADGAYTLTPTGDNIDLDPMYVTINKNSTSITVDPDYSREYLAGISQQESASIDGALQAAYPNILAQYTINDSKLYKHGEWGIIALESTGGEDVDVYSIVLHKMNGVWQAATKPSLHFTYAEYPSVPRDILYRANVGN